MKTKRPLQFAILLIVILLTAETGFSARLYIDINQPFSKKIPLAIADFVPLQAGGAVSLEYAEKLPALMRTNLDRTGLFIILDKRTHLEADATAGITGPDIKYKDWLTIGAELLIKSGYTLRQDELTLELRLYDVFEKRMLKGKRYVSRPEDKYAILNKFMNEVLLELTGEPGPFGSAIAFVAQNEKNKEIYLSKFGDPVSVALTRNGAINLSPRLDRTGERLAYISYKSGKPNLYVLKLPRGGEKRVSRDPGLYISPRFSPKGDLTAAISRRNNTNIFRLNSLGKITSQLTWRSGINISPTFSPDGKQMAFVSDRAGHPQIYIKILETQESFRLTFEGDYNTDPQWSPRGDRIIYVGGMNGRFNIYSIKPDGTQRIQLTGDEFDDMKPAWSPDGRLIVFSSNRSGRFELFTMTSNGERQIPLDFNFSGDEKSPTWALGKIN